MSLMKGLLINAQMTMGLSASPQAQAKGDRALHHMPNLIRAQTKNTCCANLALGLEQSGYRFFSSRSVNRSPASAQGTATLTTCPSIRYRGIRAVMYVLYCHKSRCRHWRGGRKSSIGKCCPATTMSGLVYSNSTCMLSSSSSVEMKDIRQSLPCGRRREARISSVLFDMPQRYRRNAYMWHRKHVNLY